MVALALLATPALGQSLELRDGQWVNAGPAAPTQAVTPARTIVSEGGPAQAPSQAPSQTPADANAALDAVQQLIDKNQGKAAFKQVVRYLTTKVRTDPDRDRALFLAAESLYVYGNRIRSFYYLDELMDGYPASGYYGPALRLQYDIADKYLDGYKARVLGIPLLTHGSEAVEMLFRIQQRAPGSPIAEQSLLRTGDFYYNDGQFDLAADTYGAFLRSYPRSPRGPVVRLRQAFANLAQFKGLRYDPTPAINARAQLVDLAATDPDLARQQDVPGLITRIDRALAGKELGKADFYRRVDQPTAAAQLYDNVEQTYPDLPESKRAAERLAKLTVPPTPDKNNEALTPQLPSQQYPLNGPGSADRAPGRIGPGGGGPLGPDLGVR